MFLFFCTKIGVNEFLHPHQKLYSQIILFNFILGLFFIIFFGGGLLNLYFNDRDKVDWKLSFLASIFVTGGIYLMINSD